METQAAILRNIAARLGLPTVKTLALQPGMKAVYRITTHYDAGRAADSVVTVRQFGSEDAVVDVVYSGHFDNRPLTHQFSRSTYEAFTTALQTLRFDTLIDQAQIPFFGVDLWLVERGAGSFVKSVLLAPRTASGVHLSLVQTVQTYLPQTVREIR